MTHASVFSFFPIKIFAAALTGLIFSVAAFSAPAQTISLDQIQHIHGLVPGPLFPGPILLATHKGLFRALPDGTVTRVSQDTSDFMSLAAAPNARKTLFASGHPVAGGTLGVLKSTDGGVSWMQIATGAAKDADFHILSPSPKNPDVIYGASKGLHVSRDGGVTWALIGPLPEKVFSLTASSQKVDRLFAGTMTGLRRSDDGGKTWQPGAPQVTPVTAVQTTKDGRLYAFLYGAGFMVAQETPAGTPLRWKVLSNAFQDRALLKLAVDPRDVLRITALAGTGQVMTSGDGGRSWTTFVNYSQQTPEQADKGRVIFQNNCATCHGEKGVGESPGNPDAKDEFGYKAPALDNSTHAWHHSDAQLRETIREGSPRNSRMQAWKETLSDAEINAVLAYVKSLWTFRSLACQGDKHMSCMN